MSSGNVSRIKANSLSGPHHGDNIRTLELLSVAFPRLVKEWMTRENGCSASVVYATSSKLAEWQCPTNEEHQYKTKVCARTDRFLPQDCPQCYTGPRIDLSNFPEAFKQYDRSSNNRGFSFKCLPVGYKVFWKCITDCRHLWYESFASMQRRQFECRLCHEAKAPKLADFPNLLSQVHPSKNGMISAKNLAAGSRTIITWKCPRGSDHEWKAPVYKRTTGREGCPFCAGSRVSRSNSLANFRDLALEFHRSRNGQLKPESILATCTKPCWWHCSACGTDWAEPVFQRVRQGKYSPHADQARPLASGVSLKLIKRLRQKLIGSCRQEMETHTSTTEAQVHE